MSVEITVPQNTVEVGITNVTVTMRSTGSIITGGAIDTHYFDNVNVYWGTGQDLDVYHDGTDSFIDNDTGKLILTSVGGIQTEPTDTTWTTLGVAAGGEFAGAINNTAIGANALNSINNIAADNNTAVGYNAGTAITSGTQNTAIGSGAGVAITTGAGNVVIGYQAGDQLTTESNQLHIHNITTTTPLIQGDFSTPSLTINGSQTIDGNTDAVQLTVQANATQTSNIFEVIDSSSNLIARFADDGSLAFPAAGTASTVISVLRDGIAAALVTAGSDTAADSGRFTIRRARTSTGSPSAISAGDRIGLFQFFGYDNAGYETAANFLAEANENWGAANHGTRLIYQVKQTGGTSTIETLRMSSAEVVINETAADIDFRVEDDAGTDLIATLGNLGAGTGGLGFHGATPVGQQAGTGETVGFTAGTGTSVNDDSTFTGNVGATAYRISDVVKALKNYGLLAS